MSDRSARPYLLVPILAFAMCEPLQAADDQVHVIPASELNQWWQSAPGGNPEPQYPPLVVDGCVAVAFEIHSDGSVSNQRVWRSAWTDSNDGRQFEQAVLKILPHWRFVPASTNTDHSAVYTYQVFTHTASLLSEPMPGAPPMPTASDRRRAISHQEQAEAPCKVSDFPQQVQAMINAGTAAKGGTQ